MLILKWLTTTGWDLKSMYVFFNNVLKKCNVDVKSILSNNINYLLNYWNLIMEWNYWKLEYVSELGIINHLKYIVI